MKLGEALTLRARQAQTLNDLKNRLLAVAQIEKDTSAVENPETLQKQFEDLSVEHQQLITDIHSTNAATMVGDTGRTLLQLLQQRDELIRRRNLYQQTADAATPQRERFYGGGEKTYLPAVDVNQLRLLVTETTEDLIRLDAQIQAVNWQTNI